MEYFWVFKRDGDFKSKKRIVLKDGYSFNQKISITLYNPSMIRYILNRKVNNSLKAIINLYLLYEDDDDARNSEVLPKIELLRSILLDSYRGFLTDKEIEEYLGKLDKIEKKIGSGKSKKSRGR